MAVLGLLLVLILKIFFQPKWFYKPDKFYNHLLSSLEIPQQTLSRDMSWVLSGSCIHCHCSQNCFCFPSPQTNILSRLSSLFYLTVFCFIYPMPSIFITHSNSSYACQNSQHISGMAKQFKFFYPSAVCSSYNCHLSLKNKYSQYAIRFDVYDCLSLM